MALSDAAYLEQLKEARDTLTAAVVSGAATVEVTIRGRTVKSLDPSAMLERINGLIDAAQQKTADANGRISLGAFGVASHRG